jgi:integrase
MLCVGEWSTTTPRRWSQTHRVTRREVLALTPQQARRLLDAARGDRLEALYSVALALGLRQGETLGLMWSDIDLKGGSHSGDQWRRRPASHPDVL